MAAKGDVGNGPVPLFSRISQDVFVQTCWRDSFGNQWMTLTLLSSHPIFIHGDPSDPIQAFSRNNSDCFKALEDLSLPDFIAAVELLLGCPERRDVFPTDGAIAVTALPRSQVGGVATWSAIRGGSEFRHPLETHVQVMGMMPEWLSLQKLNSNLRRYLGLGCLSARCCHFHRPSLCQNLKMFEECHRVWQWNQI